MAKRRSIEVTFPMSVYARPMPDEPAEQAFLYGPLLLAGVVGDGTVPQSLAVDPNFKNTLPRPCPSCTLLSSIRMNGQERAQTR